MEKLSIQKIEEREIKSGKMQGNKYLSIETDKGKVSCFDMGLFAKVKEAQGKEVEAEIVVKDNYKNLVKIERILGEAKPSAFDENARLRRITDCVLKAADLAIADKIKIEELPKKAQDLYAFILEIAENESKFAGIKTAGEMQG